MTKCGLELFGDAPPNLFGPWMKSLDVVQVYPIVERNQNSAGQSMSVKSYWDRLDALMM
jgi:hypothetical protein